MRVIQDSDDDLSDQSETEAVLDTIGALIQTRNSITAPAYSVGWKGSSPAQETAHHLLQYSEPFHKDSAPIAQPLGTHHATEGSHHQTFMPISQFKSQVFLLPGTLPPNFSDAQDKSQNIPSKVSPSDHDRSTAEFDAIMANDASIWNLGSFMRNDYAHHDPTILFPEPSSTVPNATLTQQRVLETVQAPVYIGSQSEGYQPDSRLHVAPSVPWSDLMNFSPVTTEDTSQANQFRSQQNSTAYIPPHSPSSISIDISRTAAPLFTFSHDSPQNEDAKSYGQILNSTFTLDCKPGLSQNLAVHSSSKCAVTISKSERKLRKPTRQPNGSYGNSTDSDDELAAAGLPKEKYSAKPTDSRYMNLDMELMTDNSIKPEKRSNAAKRRKTAPVEDKIIVTPRKVQRICDMGFTPSSTRGALMGNGGDVMRAVEWLVSHHLDVDELAEDSVSATKSPSKTSCPKNPSNTKISTESTHSPKLVPLASPISHRSDMVDRVGDSMAVPYILTEEVQDAETMSSTFGLRSPKVRVRIVVQSPEAERSKITGMGRVATKKAKRRNVDSDIIVAIHDPDMLHDAVVQKKRGRGRPRKTAVGAKLDRLDVAVAALEEASTKAPTTENPEAKPQDIITKSTPHVNIDKMQALSAGLPLHLSPKAPREVSLGSGSAMKQTPRVAGTSQSPVKDSRKVPHRVGLSKRARIAPLLRMCRN